MAPKWTKKQKNFGDDTSAPVSSKPERIANKLENKLIKEDKPVPARYWQKRNKIIASLIVFIILVAGVLVWGSYSNKNQSPKSNKKAIFTIGDREYALYDIRIYLTELNKRGVKEEDAVQAVKEALVFDYISSKYNISASEAEIKKAINRNTQYKDSDIDTNSWARLAGKRMVIEPKVRAMHDNSRKGYVFAFYFGSLVDTGIDLNKSEKEKLLPGAGDTARIQADKDYAKQKSKEYWDDLNNKKISPNDALLKIKADKRLNPDYGSLSYSLSYGLDNRMSWDQQIGHRPVVNYIEQSQLEINKPSDIQTVKQQYLTKDSEYESYYFFIYPTSSSGSYTEIKKLLDKHGLNKVSEVKK